MADGGGGSVTVPMLGLLAGYTVISFGYVLLRGWNISIGQWVNPLKGFQWPAGGADPLCIPSGQLWPNGSGGQQCGGGSTSSTAAAPKNPAVAATGAPANSVGAVGGGFGR